MNGADKPTVPDAVKMAHQTARLKEIFSQAIEIDAPQERAAFLREACGDDARLLADVTSLLDAHENADRFLSDFVSGMGDTPLFASSEDLAATTIGPYVLREKLGEGGMGVVYVAEQTQTVRRKVALKIIKPGMASKQVIARFEAERQALAVLSHPNIARILDGGTTDSGRPYFVMELVRGMPIHKFCDLHQLTIRDRLRLFIKVCQAVQHSHLKGIIHRDLKPNNVLVEEHDVDAVPKVIDFGIAKALHQPLTDHSAYTQFAQFMGTPDYMSPEQARLSATDVDTRSDVYSLGVMLYELLTGALPFDTGSKNNRDWEEIRRMIREDDPLRPSHKVSTFEDQRLSTISLHRRCDPRQLSLSMRRELDWIVMKALEKDRARRYESAADLARDIRRYLNNEPVRACPPSAMYRLRKMVAKHRTFFIAASLVLLTAVAGTVTSLMYARKANASATTSRIATVRAERQARAAERAKHHVQQLLYATDIELAHQFWNAGDLPTLHVVLDRYADAANTGGEDFRGIEWWLLNSMAAVKSEPLAASDEQGCLVRFSPDGRYLILGWTNGSIEVQDTATHQTSMVLDGDGDFVNGCDFHPHAPIVATITDDGKIRLWDLVQKQLVRTFTALERHGHRVFFSADGRTLVSSGEEGCVRFWDTETGEARGIIEGFSDSMHAGVERRFAQSPARDLLAIADGNGNAGLYDFETREKICGLAGIKIENSPRCFRFSHDGRFVAAGNSDRTISIWNADNGELVSTFRGHRDDVLDLAFHPRGGLLASGDRAGNVRTWKLPVDQSEEQGPHKNDFTREWPAVFRVHEDRVLSLDFAPDGKQLITGSRDCTFRIQSARQGKLWRELEFAYDFTAAFIDGGRKLLLADHEKLEIWDPEADARRTLNTFASPAWGLAVSQDGRVAVSSHLDGSLNLWNPRSGELQFTYHRRVVDDYVGHWSFISHDGRIVVVSGANEFGVTVLNIADGRLTKSPVVLDKHEGGWMPPEADVFLTHRLNELMAFDVKTGAMIQKFSGHTNSVRDVAFSRHRQLMASASRDRTVRLWRIADGKLLHTIPAHAHPVNCVDISPDNRTVVSGDVGGQLVFSHVATGRVLMSMTLADDSVYDVQFSQDGRYLMVAYGYRMFLLSLESLIDTAAAK